MLLSLLFQVLPFYVLKAAPVPSLFMLFFHTFPFDFAVRFRTTRIFLLSTFLVFV